jgi:hypothetical protein
MAKPTTRDNVRAKATQRGWTWVASGLTDTYSRPVSGWESPIKPNGVPAWDDIANWKPREMVQVLYDADGDPLHAQIVAPDQTALGQGRWVGSLDTATGSLAQQVTKVNAWLDKQAT